MAKPPPIAPEWLGEEAKAEWARVLSCHRVSERELGILAAYCQAFGRWRQAEAAIDRDGSEIVIRDAKGTVKNILSSPHVKNSAQAHGQMMKSAVELGLTAGRHGGVAVKVPGADS